ncbi:PREDICTED: uncharacterized protein LOC107067490 [Polistes dominula]|uniref:Uncharacterized protein LOC107067490 n=1 Tax=Polistes dominula TaxID=743375 RepID=A0ABM1IEB4_POLDO|nr:PREDICTED: uncharacterized protein LOC107067490 [Polistes dominula]
MLSSLFIKNNLITKLLVNSSKSSLILSQKRTICKPSSLLRRILEKPRINSETKYCLIRCKQTQLWDTKPNLMNNVILYKKKCINPLFIHLFGLCNSAALLFLIGYWCKDMYHSFMNASFKEFSGNNYPIIFMFLAMTLAGPLFYLFSWLLNARLIKCIILHKGGDHVSFITNHLLKSRNTITTPVKNVYSLSSRTEKIGVYMSVKIESYRLYFLLDKSGKYVNKDLFDYAVMYKKADKLK